MPPPFEEWWRGIKCYPCPCVRPCVRSLSKFGVRSITFERLLRFHSNLACLYKTSKHRSSSIWVTIHWFLTELWAFYKKHSTKIGVRSITFERLHRFDSYMACSCIISKHRSSSIWVTIHWFFTELWAFYKHIVQKLVSAQKLLKDCIDSIHIWHVDI